MPKEENALVGKIVDILVFVAAALMALSIGAEAYRVHQIRAVGPAVSGVLVISKPLARVLLEKYHRKEARELARNRVTAQKQRGKR